MFLELNVRADVRIFCSESSESELEWTSNTSTQVPDTSIAQKRRKFLDSSFTSCHVVYINLKGIAY